MLDGLDLDVAASLLPEVPDVDARRLDAKARKRGAHLASVIRPVVQRLGELDAHRGVSLEPVVLVDLS